MGYDACPFRHLLIKRIGVRFCGSISVQRERMAAAFPLGRFGEVGDVVSTALFLLSDAAGWITGCTFDVAGGRVML
jgi:NAD(P)-dependent dehydrogenase (short-subunit alcohol dehydrogenase family)